MNYYISKGGQQIGPFPVDQTRQMLASGLVDAADLCWREGLATWVPLSQEIEGVSPVGALATTSTNYAGFWLRVLASILDQLVLILPGFIFGFVAGLVLGAAGASKLSIQLAGNLVGLVIGWLYFACMESSSHQATPGKLVLGLRVTDESGQRIGFGRASGRHFGKFVSAIILGIGFLMAGFTARKQALHDLMAGTLVLRK